MTFSTNNQDPITEVCNLQEETDWECGSNDEDSDDEEIRAGTVYMEQAATVAGAASRGKEVFPLLAPPDLLQSPSFPLRVWQPNAQKKARLCPAR